MPPPANRPWRACRPGIWAISIRRRTARPSQADFAKAEQAARAFAAAHQGKLAAMSGGVLAAAIADYERIEEVLGRLMSYAQLLFAGDSTNAEIGRFYQTMQRAGDGDQQPPAVLHAGAEPAGRCGAGAEARRTRRWRAGGPGCATCACSGRTSSPTSWRSCCTRRR